MPTEKTFRKWHKVGWPSAGGAAEGKAVRWLTAPMDIKGYHVAASKGAFV